MVIKSDQERVRALITEAITVLCKNGLTFRAEFQVEGLLGITLDQDEVFLVNIKQTIKTDGSQVSHDGDKGTHNGTSLQTPVSAVALQKSQPSPSNTASLHATPSRPGQRARRKRSANSRSSTPHEKSDSNQTFPTDPTQLSLSDEPVFGSDLIGDVSDLNSRNETGQPPSKRHATDSDVRKDSTENEHVVVKEEALSDNEDGDTEGYDSYNQGGYEEEEGHDDPKPGCSTWDPSSANAYSDSSSSSVVPSMTTAQSQVNMFASARSSEDLGIPDHQIVVDCQRTILRFPGKIVLSSTFTHCFRKFKAIIVEMAMKMMDQEEGDPLYVGKFSRRGCSNMFEKCSPDIIAPAALDYFEMTKEDYVSSFHLEQEGKDYLVMSDVRKTTKKDEPPLKSEYIKPKELIKVPTTPKHSIPTDLYLKQSILLNEGPVVYTRLLMRKKKLRKDDLREAMESMALPMGSDNFIGQCKMVDYAGRQQQMVFYKAAPHLVKPETFSLYGISAETYNEKYHLSIQAAITDWRTFVEAMMCSCPFGAENMPLEYMNLTADALEEVRQLQSHLARLQATGEQDDYKAENGQCGQTHGYHISNQF